MPKSASKILPVASGSAVSTNSPTAGGQEGRKKKRRKRPSNAEPAADNQSTAAEDTTSEGPSSRLKKKKRKKRKSSHQGTRAEASTPEGPGDSSHAEDARESVALPPVTGPPPPTPRLFDRIISIFRPDSSQQPSGHNVDVATSTRSSSPQDEQPEATGSPEKPVLVASPSKRKVITYEGKRKAQALALQAARAAAPSSSPEPPTVGSLQQTTTENEELEPQNSDGNVINARNTNGKSKRITGDPVSPTAVVSGESNKASKKTRQIKEKTATNPSRTSETPKKVSNPSSQSRAHDVTPSTRKASTPVIPFGTEPDHVRTRRHMEMLATKWLPPAALKRLVEVEGLEYTKGMFSAVEESTVKKAIDTYSQVHQLSEDDLLSIIFAKGKGARASAKHEDFFKDIARAVAGRPLCSVHAFVQRKYDPNNKKGAWTEEEDEELLRAHSKHGPQWTKIAEHLERSAADCRDRYRNYIGVKESRRTGPWSAEEEQELIDAVKEVSSGQGKELDNTSSEVLWTAVSAKMGNVRSRAQCRVKWTDSMFPKIKREGGFNQSLAGSPKSPASRKSRVWGAGHGVQMMRRLIDQEKTDVDDLDFKKIMTPDWDIFPVRTIQVRFKNLKTRICRINNWDEDEVEQGVDFKNLLKAMLADQIAATDKSAAVIRLDVDDEDDVDEDFMDIDPVLSPVAHKEATSNKRKLSKEFIEDEDGNHADEDSTADAGPSPAQPLPRQKTLTPESDAAEQNEEGTPTRSKIKHKKTKRARLEEEEGLTKAEKKQRKADKKARKAEKKRQREALASETAEMTE